MKSVDFNADLGESFGNYNIGNDRAVMDYVTSVNIACGFHAGDPVVIRKTVIMAIENGVSIGAHPGYPDMQGFGRRYMSLSPDEVYSYILYQVGAIKSITEAEGGSLNHVKAHGALYNSAVNDPELADAIVTACGALDNSLIIYGPPNSEIENSAIKRGMQFALEAFADRAYNNDGTLVPRALPGSVITDTSIVLERVAQMVIDNRISTYEGGSLIIKPDTICLHGDNLHALEIAGKIRDFLGKEGVNVKSLQRN